MIVCINMGSNLGINYLLQGYGKIWGIIGDGSGLVEASLRNRLRTRHFSNGNAGIGWVGTRNEKSEYLTKPAPGIKIRKACFESFSKGWVSECPQVLSAGRRPTPLHSRMTTNSRYLIA
eukprot:1911760-Amphidinium_carterae.1